MTPAKLKLTVYQGATFRKVLTWKIGTPAAPIDLTGCTARMHIRSEVTSADPLVNINTENGGITLGGTAGTITLLITAAETTALVWETGVYDLEVVFPNGDVRRLLFGDVIVSPEVTR